MCLPFEHKSLLVDQSFEFLFSFASIVFLSLNLVAGTNCSKLGIFNFLGLGVKNFNKSGNHVVK